MGVGRLLVVCRVKGLFFLLFDFETSYIDTKQ